MARWAALLVACAAIPALVARGQEPTFRAGETQIVPVFATVTDGQGRLIGGLQREDFEILDNGRPTPILLFDNTPQPISVAMLLDTSGSMTLYIDFLLQAAEQFLLRILPDDRVMLGAFNDKIQFATDLTSDRDRLIRSLTLDDLGFGNGTRLYDAIDTGLEKLRHVDGRRVVLAFTDGEDTTSSLSSRSVVERARSDEAMVYAIGLQTEYFNGQRFVKTTPDRGLRRLTDETGGGYFDLKKTDELGPTFTRIAQELHSQYALGFAPATDGKQRKITVKVNRPGLNARARRTYQAPSAADGTR